MKWIVVAVVALLAVNPSLARDKVLYVTHEPGRWHEYTQQLKAFREIAARAEWELTVATGSVENTLEFLKSENFAVGQDAVVYNFCLAASQDVEAMSNLIGQTSVNGVPAMLIHCSMHSWWGTFKKGKAIPGNVAGKARANGRLLKQWQKSNPDEPLPAWGDFTGVASTSHGPKTPIALTSVIEHTVTARVPSGYKTVATELYNNHYVGDDVIPLLQGKQEEDEAVVMWLAPRGDSEIIGLTLGHGNEEWNDPVFQMLLLDGVRYLVD